MRFFTFRRGLLSLRLFDRTRGFFRRGPIRRATFSFAGLGISRRSGWNRPAAPRVQAATAPQAAARAPSAHGRLRRAAGRRDLARRGRNGWSRPLRSGESLERRALLAAQDFAGFSLDLLDADDTGVSNSDNITRITQPTVTTASLDGLAITAGSQIEILRGGAVVGSYTVSAADLVGGVWGVGGKPIQLSTSLQEGANSLTFRNREGATVGAASTTPLVVTLDTSSPTPGAPTIVGSGIRRPGDIVSFDVVFSEPVVVTGSPRLSINVGTAGFGAGPVSRVATYTSGSGSSTLRFSYQVGSDVSNDVDGIDFAFPLTLPFGASIRDGAGNDANLGSGSGTLSGATVLTTAATVTMTTLNNPGGAPQGEARATPVPVVDLEFSAPVARGLGEGLLELADFELTRDGVVVHGRQTPWPTFVALTQSVEDPRRFQISNLSQITEPSGTYILTFGDLGIGEARSITWLKTGPTPAELTAVMAPSPSGTSPRRVPVDSVTVTFQDVNNAPVNVVGVSIDDFTLSYNGGPDILAAAAATGQVTISGSGNTYVIAGLASLQLDAITGEPLQGSYRLELPAGAVTGIVTLAEGQLLAPVDAGWTFDVEPTVSEFTVVTAPGTLGSGAAIEFTVRFNEPVFVTGTLTLPIAVGTATRQAAYVAGHGTDTLRFSYTVVTGDEDRDGITFVPATGTTRYEILGGSIVDAAGSAARREFVPPAATGILVDAVHPTVLAGGVTGPLFGHYVSGETLTFRVAFDEAVIVTGGPRLQLSINGSTRTAFLTVSSQIDAGAAPGATFLEFEYEIGPGDFTSPTGSSITVQGIQLFGGSIRDEQGNDAVLSPFTAASFPLTINRVAPTVLVSPPAAPATAYRSGDAILFTVSYGVDGDPRSVIVTGTPEFSFQIGSRTATATYIGGSQSSTLVFRSTVQANDLAPGGITIPDPTIRNGSIVAEGTGGAVASLFVLDDLTDLSLVVVDAVAPRLVPESVTTPEARSYSTGESLTFTVDFDEPVLVTGSPRLSFTLGTGGGAPTRQARLTAASAAAAAMDPGTVTLEFEYEILATDSSITGVRVTGLALAGGAITDVPGNAAVAATLAPLSVTSEAFAVNATGVDAVTIEEGTYPIGSEVVFVVEFSAPVNVTGVPQIPFLLAGGTTRNATFLSGSGTSTLRFRYIVQSGDSAPNGIVLSGNAIVGGSITTLGGTPTAVGFAAPDNLADVLVDGIAPRALVVNGPTPGTYVTQTPDQDILTFTVLMDDTVTVVADVNPMLRFTLGNNTRQAVFAGFGFGDTTGTVLLFEYEVQPGDFGLSVSIPSNPIRLNGATVRDVAGNDADFSGIGGGAATPGVIVNQTAVQIETEEGESGVRLQDPDTQDNRYYRAGETILLEVGFTAPVTVAGSPSLRLAFDHAGGSTTRDATYVSGSGTDTLLFAYTVRVGDFDPDGLHFASSSIQLNGGTITNAGGNVLLSFVPPVITGVRVDAVTPRLLGVDVPAAGRYKTGDLLQFSVRFDESMLVDDAAGTPYLALVIGSTTQRAEFVAGSETPVLIFEYEVQEGDLDTNGIVLSTAIQLAGGKITDLAGNTGTLFFPAQTTSGIIIDGVAPTLVRISSSTPNGRYTVGAAITITATVSEAVQAGSAIEVELNSGGFATLTALADGTSLVGTYLVETGENTAPGDRLDVVNVVDLGTLDLAGNAVDPTLPGPANLIAATRNIVIDTLAPAVVAFTSTTPDGSYAAGSTINVRAEVSEDVRPGSSFTVTLDVGATVTLVRTSAPTVLSGSFVVAAGQNTAALKVTGYDAGTLLDLAGNALDTLDLPADNIDSSATIVVDTTAPTIVGFGASSLAGDGSGLSGIFVAGDEVFLTATASEEVRGGSFVLVTLNTGAVVRMEALADGDFLEGTYVVPVAPPGHATAALDVVSFTTGSVQDLVGNVLVDTTVPVGGNISAVQTLVIDSVPPVLTSIAADVTALRKGQTAVVTFTFSEPVLGFTTLDVTRLGGTITTLVPVSPTVFTTVFTPNDDAVGTATLSVAAGTFTDLAGNGNADGNQLSVPFDTLAPTVAITDDIVGTVTGPVTFTFTFSEAVSGFTANGVVVANGTKGTFEQVTPSLYTLVVVPTANTQGTLTVTVPAGAAADAFGNANVAASATQAIDTLAPTVVITDDAPAVATGPVTFTFTFAEPVTGFSVNAVSVTNGTKGAFTVVSSSVYTLVISPASSQEGTLTVAVPAGAAFDLAGNASVAASVTQAFDTLAPVPTITDDVAGTTTGPVTFTFTFSEPVTGFTAANVAVTNGTKGTFTAVSTSVYRLVVSPPTEGAGSIIVSVPAGAAFDLAGNPSIAASAAQAFDLTAPVPTITDDVSGIATGPVVFTFTFSKPVTGFTAADVLIVNGTPGAFSVVSQSVYQLEVTPTAATAGTMTVTVPAGAATDLIGNPSAAASVTQAFDTLAPTLAITDDVSGIATGPLTFTFTFSEAVTDFTADDVTVTNGTKGLFTAASGSVYTLVVTPTASAEGTLTVSVPAGAATDLAGNPSAAASATQAFDTLAPTLAITDGVTGTATGPVTFTFTFSEAVTGFTADDVTVTNGTKGLFTAVSGSVYTLVVTPTASAEGTLTVSVPAGAATDPAGNPSTAASATQAFDTLAPVILRISGSRSGTLDIGDSLIITATLSEAAQPGGTVTARLNTGANVVLTVGPGGTTAMGTYVVQPGQTASPLNVVAIAPNGSLRDLAGNALTSTQPPQGADNLGGQNAIVVNGAVQPLPPDGFSTDPSIIPDIKVAVSRINLSFNTPVTGLSVASFRLFLNGRSVSLRGARLTGQGSEFTLVLPPRRTVPRGIYSLQIGPDAAVTAANGATLDTATTIYWSRGLVNSRLARAARLKAFASYR